MRRALRKAFATAAAALMAASAVFTGGITNAFATTQFNYEVYSTGDETLYDDYLYPGYDNEDGIAFMQNGSFSKEANENTKLVLQSFDGKITEIKSVSNGQVNFDKVDKLASGSYYNYVLLHKGEQMAILDYSGKYFGGAKQYYDYIDNDMCGKLYVLVGKKNGSTMDYFLLFKNGSKLQLAAGEPSDIKYIAASAGNSFVIKVTDKNNASKIYYFDNEENSCIELNDFSFDSFVSTSGSYFTFKSGTTNYVFDSHLNFVTQFEGSYTHIDTAYISQAYIMVYSSTTGYNIIDKYGNKLIDNKGKTVFRLSVIDGSRGIFSVTYRWMVDQENYKFDYSQEIVSADKSINVNLTEMFNNLGKESGYSNVTGNCYIYDQDVVMNIINSDDKNQGAVYAYKADSSYQTKVKLTGNYVELSGDYLVTSDRKIEQTQVESKPGYSYSSKNTRYTLKNIYNSDYKKIDFKTNYEYTYFYKIDNEKFVGYISLKEAAQDGSRYVLLDNTGTGYSVRQISQPSGMLVVTYTEGKKVIYDSKGNQVLKNLDDIINGKDSVGISINYGQMVTLSNSGTGVNKIYNGEGKLLHDAGDFSISSSGFSPNYDFYAVEYKKVDGVSKYKGVIIKNTSTGLCEDYNGTIKYYDNGKFKTVTGVYSFGSDWYYTKLGTVDKRFTGLAANDFGWWYVKDGKVDFSKTGLVYDENVGWWYVENGAINFGYTGLIYDANLGWWYVEGGRIAFEKTGLVYDPYVGWWYVEGGTIAFGKTGLVYDDNLGWWYAEGGRIAFEKTGLVYDANLGWWYVDGARVAFERTGLVNDANLGWWYVQGGTIVFGTGLVFDPYVGWWYVEGGTINFNYTGNVANENGTWWVQGGMLIF